MLLNEQDEIQLDRGKVQDPLLNRYRSEAGQRWLQTRTDRTYRAQCMLTM